MVGSFLIKRRQILRFGGTGIVSFLGGATVIKATDVYANASVQANQNSSTQSNGQPYLNAGGFDQQFLAKSADIKQIWDFVTTDQIYPQGLAAIRNAMNAFQFTYKKTLYPVICLRGAAVIYALSDKAWIRYSIGSSSSSTSVPITGNPLYKRRTTDNGSLSSGYPNSLYQDFSLQALMQRGAHVAVCNDALNGFAEQLAKQHGLLIDSTFNELVAYLVPDAQRTPSGSSLIAVAQHLGFTYAKQ